MSYMSHRFGKDVKMETNDGYDNRYPRDADYYSILSMQDIDDKYENFDTTDFYYGWKECKKLGIEYTYPNPEVYNNTME